MPKVTVVQDVSKIAFRLVTRTSDSFRSPLRDGDTTRAIVVLADTEGKQIEPMVDVDIIADSENPLGLKAVISESQPNSKKAFFETLAKSGIVFRKRTHEKFAERISQELTARLIFSRDAE